MKTCPNCKIKHKKRGKYCCSKCYYSFPKSKEFKRKISKIHKGKKLSKETKKKMSDSAKGVPKPWNCGENNPNYQNKAQSKVHDKFLNAVKLRGQPWGEKERKEHSERMLGDCNKMRGRTHSAETKQKISALKIKQYKDGTVNIKTYRSSKAEKEIAEYMSKMGIEFIQQFFIKGNQYRYDFFIPKLNLIIEYQGNYWHANPRLYKSGTMLKIRNIGDVSVNEIWKRDNLKKELALQQGYDIKYIWEDEYKKYGMSLIDKFIQ